MFCYGISQYDRTVEHKEIAINTCIIVHEGYRFVSICSFTMYSDAVICSFCGAFQRADASYFNYAVASLDSTDQTPNANGGDWQEEVHQKVLYIK